MFVTIVHQQNLINESGLKNNLSSVIVLCSNLSLPERRSASSQTEGIVTVISVGSPPSRMTAPPPTTRPQLISASTSTRDITGPPRHYSLHSLTRLPRGAAASASNVLMLRPHPSKSSVVNNNVTVTGSRIVTPSQPQGTVTVTTSSVITSTSSSTLNSVVTTERKAIPQQIVRTTIAGSKAHDDRGEPRHLPTVTTATADTTPPPPPPSHPHAVSHTMFKFLTNFIISLKKRLHSGEMLRLRHTGK